MGLDFRKMLNFKFVSNVTFKLIDELLAIYYEISM